MKNSWRNSIVCILSFFCLAFVCIKPLLLQFPSFFPEPVYDFAKNPLTEEKVVLGRHLFYDPILSRDSTISCASCHSPFNAFAHTDHDLSHGIGDSIGSRNAPALMNLAWHNSFMWDGAINHLDVQALGPISHPKEMGEDIARVVKKLQASEKYRLLFQKAFGQNKITGEYVLKSLSQFQLTLVSANSKYDRVKQNKDVFTEQEERGYVLFQRFCNSCHTEPLFLNNRFENNGLPIDPSLNDYGKWTITHQSKDSLKFKVPTLRNLTYTYPYMHDGRFKKLYEVLNHYTNGILQSATLAEQFRSPIVLSSDEKTDLIAFLLTLNDKEFVFDPRFQFPKN